VAAPLPHVVDHWDHEVHGLHAAGTAQQVAPVEMPIVAMLEPGQGVPPQRTEHERERLTEPV